MSKRPRLPIIGPIVYISRRLKGLPKTWSAHRLPGILVGLAIMTGACGGTSPAPPKPPTSSPTSTATPSPTAMATPAPAVASCVVGTWRQVNNTGTDTQSFPGVTLQDSGGAGVTVTFTSAGIETDNYANSSNFIERGGGHIVTVQVRGTTIYDFKAAAGNWAESGGSGAITAVGTYDGTPTPPHTSLPAPETGTYTCTSTTLTLQALTPPEAAYTSVSTRVSG